MPEAFKLVFNHGAINDFGKGIQQHYPEFDIKTFCEIAGNNLSQLELKARSEQIVQALATCLPTHFTHASHILSASLAEDGVAGWMIMPLSEYAGRFGDQDFKSAMALLHGATQVFSAEFGIRHLLKRYPKDCLSVLQTWTKDPSEHVRRLASEGTRPSLPWGIQLPLFLHDPKHTYPILEALRDDEHEYVRRSVANHINDLSKHHPEWTVKLAREWMRGASQQRIKLLKHACRTLFKQGNSEILALFGFVPPQISHASLTISTPKVVFGDAVQFTFTAQSMSENAQNWMVDYILHHRKANGSLAPKVFKWKSIKVNAKQRVTWHKNHAIKPITTRKYYDGEHTITLVINGQSIQTQAFTLSNTQD